MKSYAAKNMDKAYDQLTGTMKKSAGEVAGPPKPVQGNGGDDGVDAGTSSAKVRWAGVRRGSTVRMRPIRGASTSTPWASAAIATPARTAP